MEAPTPSSRTATVVVGVDGSAAARSAVVWAAEEAGRRGAVLRIVHAWNVPVVASPWADGAVPPVDMTTLERAARNVVRAAATTVDEALGATAPPVEAAVAEGSPVAVLVDASADADLLVVGTRGHGRLVSTIIGSTAAGCAHRSRVPVVVVGEDAPSLRGGEILAGFDGSAGSVTALRWAATCAVAADVPLRVIHSWSPDLAAPFGGPSDGSAAWDLADPTPEVEAQVAEALADLDARPPIEVEVVPAPAGTALVDEAAHASLLVVGTRGHGDLAGLLLGSVSSRCLHLSPCPVVLVPTEPVRHDGAPAAVGATGGVPDPSERP